MALTVKPSKTQDQTLVAWQDIATANVVVGSALDVSLAFAAAIAIRIARRSGTAFSLGSPTVRLEGSNKSSGNDQWIPLFPVTPAVGSSIVNTTLNGAVSAGASSFVVTANTNIGAGDVLFLGDSSTANYELVRVKSVSGTTITPEENVTFAHANAAIVTDQAEVFFPAIDLAPYGRVRAVIENYSGQSISAQVKCTTHDFNNVA